MVYQTQLFNIDFNTHKASAVIQAGGFSINIVDVPVPHTPGETEDQLKRSAHKAISDALRAAADGWLI